MEEETTNNIEKAEEYHGSGSQSSASSSDPEILFSKTPSSLTFDDSNLTGVRSDSTTDYLMTAKEILELDNRLEEVVDRLQKQREDFEKWENDLNKRRIVAFGRLKALGKFHRQRMDVYDTVKDYLQTINTGRRSRPPTSKKSF